MKSVLTGVAGYLRKRGVAAEQRKAGLCAASLKLSSGRFDYLLRSGTGGQAPMTILMLHGASAERCYWLRFARHMGPEFTLVMPDLSGLGSAATLEGSTAAQAARIKEFLCRQTLGRVHIVASATDAATALHLAAQWPALVRSLTLIGAAGAGQAVPDGVGHVALADAPHQVARRCMSFLTGAPAA